MSEEYKLVDEVDICIFLVTGCLIIMLLILNSDLYLFFISVIAPSEEVKSKRCLLL